MGTAGLIKTAWLISSQVSEAVVPGALSRNPSLPQAEPREGDAVIDQDASSTDQLQKGTTT
jgi:hypothetical protein